MVNVVVLFKAKDRIGWVGGRTYGYSSRTKCPIWIEVLIAKDKDGFKKLSITGAVLSPNGRTWVEGGQINDTLLEYINKGLFKPDIDRGWTIEDVKELLKIWEVWHLNTIKPVPEELKDEYLKFRNEFKEKYGRYPEYEDYVREFWKDFGKRWHSWKLPDSVVDWIVNKFKGGVVYVNRL